jgi:membrane protease YdiL (CAAX protease family)
MKTRRRSRWVLYAAALLAPVVCCLIVPAVLSLAPVDPFWLVRDYSAFLMLILFYPIIEELSFRGVIQGSLLRWTQHRELVPGLTLANTITSFLFVAVHFVYHSPMWAVAVWVPSLIFGYFRDRFESVVPAVLLHAFYNLIFYATMGK